MRTPRAAAVAGIVFSALLITALLLLRLSVPVEPLKPEAWLKVRPGRVILALNLVPFAGIAFLWFIGVLRDRLGALEDRFFATVFLGSGLLFLAMLFIGAAALGALIMVQATEPQALLRSPALALARALASNIASIYAIRMAAVFMIVTFTRHPHRLCAPLDGLPGLCAVAAPAVRQPVVGLGFWSLSCLGVSHQPLHPGGQPASSPRLAADEK